MTRPLHVQWTLNLGVDLQVPVVQAPIAIMFKTKCDRYGFVSESEKMKTAAISSRTFQKVETVKQRKRRVALETLRSQKWLDMMKSSSLLSHPKLSSRTWKGVPDALRSSVWPILAGVHSSMSLENNKKETLFKGKTYEEHLASGSDPKNFTDMSRPGGTIDRDLRRTFPTAILLKDSKGRRSLRNILIAYHNYDRDLQYTQGMNFFSAMFLSYMPESDAFWMLVAVMAPPYGLSDLLLINNGVVWTYTDVLGT